MVKWENLCKSYHGRSEVVHALRGIDDGIDEGEFLAVMGASGSGKSTLLHLSAGLDRPDSGRVIVDGNDLSQLADKQLSAFRRQRVGVVFQSFNLLPMLTARQNIAIPLLADGMRQRHIDQRIDKVIELTDLRDRQHHRPDALSGGEQQRVAVARALLSDPAVILADEPTGNLDSGNAQKLWALMRSLCDEHGRTVMMVTHEAAGAAYADRILVLKDGQSVGSICPSGDRDATVVANRYQQLAG